MKNLILITLISAAVALFIFYGCDGDHTTNVTVEDGEASGTGGDGGKITVIDTVYLDDCPPCDPDTVYGDCPPCPSGDNPYEGVFYINSSEMKDVAQSCGYTFVTTNYQTVTIRDGMICFAGWMVEWDESTRSGASEWYEHLEDSGQFYDYSISFTITFSDTDHLTAVLTYHIEAGYIGSGVSYICDDQFAVTAERTTVEGALPRLEKNILPRPRLTEK